MSHGALQGAGVTIAVRLPELGESVVEGTLARWLVAEGDTVELDQPLCEVTTDKVDAEIPAPAAGRVGPLLVKEGSEVAVGAELTRIEAGGAVAAPGPPPAADESLRATPVARRLAEGADLDLRDVAGSGHAGRITKADVLSHTAEAPRAAEPPEAPVAPIAVGAARGAEAPTAASAAPSSPFAVEVEEGDRVVPMSPQRRLIAAHMVYSKQSAPHVGSVAEVDLGAVAALRRDAGPDFEARHGIKLTYLPFVAAAVTRALGEHRALNAAVDGETIVERGHIHLAIAVETEKGLVAPVVRDADRLSLSGLALAFHELSERARSKRLSPDDLRGGTFTVSNPGRRGNLYGFAIINQPQVGILRMGELVKRPVVRTLDGADTIAIRPMMHLALSYDHRAVDGQPANAFLFRVRELLEAADFAL